MPLPLALAASPWHLVPGALAAGDDFGGIVAIVLVIIVLSVIGQVSQAAEQKKAKERADELLRRQRERMRQGAPPPPAPAAPSWQAKVDAPQLSTAQPVAAKPRPVDLGESAPQRLVADAPPVQLMTHERRANVQAATMAGRTRRAVPVPAPKSAAPPPLAAHEVLDKHASSAVATPKRKRGADAVAGPGADRQGKATGGTRGLGVLAPGPLLKGIVLAEVLSRPVGQRGPDGEGGALPRLY